MRNVLLVATGIIAVALLSTILPGALLAQTADDPSGLVFGWICANPTLVEGVLGFLIAHSGLSVISAFLKKFGITEDTPIVGPYVKIIRLLAVDVKPPPATIVAQAAAIQADPATKV